MLEAPGAHVASGVSPSRGEVEFSLPLGDSFDLVAFIDEHFMLKGDFERFESMEIQELRKLALGFEFKGLVLNYFLSRHQEKDAATASKGFEERLADLKKSLEKTHGAAIEELAKSHKAALEKAKSDSEGSLVALKKVYADDRLVLEGKLRALEKSGRNWLRGRNSMIVAIAQASEEVAFLRGDIEDLGETNTALKEEMAEKYVDGFASAIEQVKVLFPDLDAETLAQADFMKTIENDQLVSRLPLGD